MPPQPRIPSQPELSPTYGASTSPTRAPPDPVRRNLFSAHLSRRPASSQSTTSRPNSQPQSQKESQPPPPLAPSQNRNISPFASPPRLSPTHLPLSFNDTYDPTVSPHRSLSPRTTTSLFPSSSIIALNPSTGRPILPTLPTLPARLRLSDSDDEAAEEEDEELDDEDLDLGDPDRDPNDSHHQIHQQPHPSTDPFAPTPHQHLSRHQQSPPLPSPAAQQDGLITDLMSRYRARRTRDDSRTAAAAATMTARPPAGQAGLTLARQDGGKGEAFEREDELEEAEEERAELMAHLMGQLRKEVVRAEEEGWMFGEVGGRSGYGDGEGLVEGGLGTGGGGGGGVGLMSPGGGGGGAGGSTAGGEGAGGGVGVNVGAGGN